MYRIRQTFDRTVVRDLPEMVRSELRKLSLERKIKPGHRVALTAGSRGVSRIDVILKVAVDFLKSIEAKPFIFPAMEAMGEPLPKARQPFWPITTLRKSQWGSPF